MERMIHLIPFADICEDQQVNVGVRQGKRHIQTETEAFPRPKDEMLYSITAGQPQDPQPVSTWVL